RCLRTSLTHLFQMERRTSDEDSSYKLRCHLERSERSQFGFMDRMIRDGKPSLADFVRCVAGSRCLSWGSPRVQNDNDLDPVKIRLSGRRSACQAWQLCILPLARFNHHEHEIITPRGCLVRGSRNKHHRAVPNSGAIPGTTTCGL